VYFNVAHHLRSQVTLQFWDICPVKNILAQLEVENPAGTKRLVKLLSGSFLPANQTMEVCTLMYFLRLGMIILKILNVVDHFDKFQYQMYLCDFFKRTC